MPIRRVAIAKFRVKYLINGSSLKDFIVEDGCGDILERAKNEGCRPI
jgi:hypothetical protein